MQNSQKRLTEAVAHPDLIDVTIVMPCLNETLSLPHCIANAQEALARIERDFGLVGEILIADNGSTDGSQRLATSLGARVEPVRDRGYGAALIGGAKAAHGKFILMGDCDGSYDFTEGVAMIGKLIDGYAVCMGSRFAGGIAPGAMPWKNRYIGNPVLTGILNLFFRTGVDDAHCGLRAITREAFDELNLSGRGMEFASEMVIKAALKKLPMTQTPATLSKDLRDRPPHLRPWRDGWRHLRYLLMLSPTWLFAIPAAAAILIGVAILFGAAMGAAGGTTMFGESWGIFGGALLTIGHMTGLMAIASHLNGVKQGYRQPRRVIRKISRYLTLEFLITTGMALMIGAAIGLIIIFSNWSSAGYQALPSVLPVILACSAFTIGTQNIISGFLIAIILGHEADFAEPARMHEGATPMTAAMMVGK